MVLLVACFKSVTSAHLQINCLKYVSICGDKIHVHSILFIDCQNPVLTKGLCFTSHKKKDLNVHIIAFVFVLYIHACICSLAYSTLLKEVTVIVNYYNTLLKILTQEN